MVDLFKAQTAPTRLSFPYGESKFEASHLWVKIRAILRPQVPVYLTGLHWGIVL